MGPLFFPSGIPMLIREHPNTVINADTTYATLIGGHERVDGTWEGWIEFHPAPIPVRC
jgi:hypothetical protein